MYTHIYIYLQAVYVDIHLHLQAVYVYTLSYPYKQYIGHTRTLTINITRSINAHKHVTHVHIQAIYVYTHMHTHKQYCKKYKCTQTCGTCTHTNSLCVHTHAHLQAVYCTSMYTDNQYIVHKCTLTSSILAHAFILAISLCTHVHLHTHLHKRTPSPHTTTQQNKTASTAPTKI